MMGRLAARNNVEVTKVDRIVENLILTNVYAIDTNFQKGNDRMLTMAGHLLQTLNVLLFIVLLLFFFCCCGLVVKEGPGTTRVTQWTCVCCV